MEAKGPVRLSLRHQSLISLLDTEEGALPVGGVKLVKNFELSIEDEEG